MKNLPGSHGGRRPGAGRKPNSGNAGEPTLVLRVPSGAKAAILDLLQMRRQLREIPAPAAIIRHAAIEPARVPLPLFGNRIPAGFPSPADDYIEDRIDLNQLLVRNPPATFFVRVQGNSMTGAGIFDGDTLVVDRSIEARSNHVIVAVIDGELTVKRLSIKRGKTRLLPENPDFTAIELKDGQELTVWGVVTNVIHAVK